MKSEFKVGDEVTCKKSESWLDARRDTEARLKKAGCGRLPKGYTPELLDEMAEPVLRTTGIWAWMSKRMRKIIEEARP